MPYKSINDLPAQVKKALGNSSKRLKAFMATFNAAMKAGKSEQAAFRIAYSAASKIEASEPMPNIVFTLDSISLEDVEFDDEESGNEIEIPVMPAQATYDHPWFGKIEFNEETLAEFQKNFKDRVLGVDIALDVSHQPDQGAIGWFTDLVDKGKQGLWAVVDMTDEGLELVRTRKFKYISPEFASTWTNPKSGKKFSNVLFGAAVTNRPFLKEMDALMVFSDQVVPFESLDLSDEGGEQSMDNRVYELLGLSEDASEDSVVEAVQALLAERQEVEHTKQFAELFPEQAKTLADLTQRLTEETVNRRLTEWTTATYALPPVVLDDIRAYRMTLYDEAGNAFDAIISKLTETGMVHTGVAGSTNASENAETPSKSQAEEFNEIVTELVDGGMDFAVALRKAEAEHPALAEAYANDRPKLDVITTDEGGE